MTAIRNEFAGAFFGVPGRFHNVHLWSSTDPKIPERARGKFSAQTFVSEWRKYSEGGARYVIRFEARFDDNCRNGHNDFAITGEVWAATHGGRKIGRDMVAGGCIHEDIAKHFPEVAHVIKWHLTGEAGPMHYAANAVYLADNRDHYGLLAGERRQIRNGRTGVLAWHLVAIDDAGEEVEIHTLQKYRYSETQPPATHRLEYRPWYRIGEGKPRDLDAARRVAIWPDATDEELSVEPAELRAALEARLPALLAEFRAMIDGSGFLWLPEA